MKPYYSYLSCRFSTCTILQNSPKRTKQRPLWIICTGLKHDVCWFQMHYLFSTSSREKYKAEAPIGIYSDKRINLQMHLLQMQMKDSFKHFSHHINVYFRRKEVAVPTVSGAFSPAQQGHLGQNLEKRAVWKDKATEAFKHVHESYVGQSEKSRLSIMYPEVQLFHMSSLVTRFGENYSYVAGHINSVFSKCLRNQATRKEPPPEDVLKQSRTKTRRVHDHEPTRKDTGSSHYNAALHKVDCYSWEEGYLHFARHINRYFGAKVADPAIESPQHQRTRSDMKPIEPSVLRSEADDLHPLRPKSVFHLSNLSTQFGENYAYMSSHINHYFKGSADTDEEMERDPYRGQAEYKSLKKPGSFIQNIFNSLPIQKLDGSPLSSFTKTVPSTDNVFDKVAKRQQLAEETTLVLLDKLAKVRSRSAISFCIEELNSHLILHPACKTVVWQKKAVMNILKHRHNSHTDKKLQAAIRETLALIGYVDPLKSCGIRVLSIDGGGTRGIVPLQVLKQLEARTGKRVYQLFDYVCGVSTGAILAFMLALTHISLEECEEMYKRFGSDVFRQNPFVGTMKMGWTHSYYSTETWEMILKEKLGDQLLIRTARDEQSPKVSAVSAVVNWGTSPKPFIFRNYNHSPGRLSRYAGGSGYQLWQAVRASSAAPGYFQEFPLYNDIHQDGGIILNNPCALAVHESRLLWANQPFQCVLSLGTGRYDNARRGPATGTSLRAKISNLISSATDTEGVHTLLADLLEPNVYFRFNPMLSADVSLDESRPQALRQLQEDTQRYLKSNEPKLQLLCDVLGEKRSKLWKTRDWISEKAWELQQRWT